MPKKKMSGYPSVDRPWLKYYSERAINAPLPEATLYEYIYEQSQGNRKKTAIHYYGNDISYQELFDKIDLVAGGLEGVGIGKSDVVTICMINSPEAVLLIFALNKIGAVANLIYGVSSEKEIKKYIEDSNSKAVFTLDVFQSKISNIFEDITPSDVIVVRTDQSMSSDDSDGQTIMQSIPEVSEVIDDRFVTWDTFLIKAKPSKILVSEPHCPAVITYTGGTTGGSKGVVQSSFGMIANIWQYCQMNIDLKSNSKWVLVFPLFIGFGLFSLLIPLSMGMTVIIRQPMADSIAHLCKKFKPNHIVYGPAFWEAFAEEEEDLDLSYLIEPMTGGDVLHPNVEKKINNYLESHGSEYCIMNGYGMSELGPGISINCKRAYESDSVGVPFVKNVVAVCDIDTGAELKYGEQGEICVCAPSMMIGYLNNQEETDNIIKKHQDGRLYIHTGDIGFISENGFIHISGRLKRYLLCIKNGVQKKIFSLDIERVLNKCPIVKKCVVVPVDDAQFNQVPVAFVILKKAEHDQLRAKEELKNYCAGKLEAIYCPVDYRFVNSFPKTRVGKIDYRSLESIVSQSV